MKLLELNISAWGVFVSIAVFAVGILSWWLAKLLADKKDVTELQVKMENVERRIQDLEDEVRGNRKHK